MSLTLPSAEVSADLVRSIRAAIQVARSEQSPALLTHAEWLPFSPDPLAFLNASSAELGDAVFWSQPQSNQTYVGAGKALEITADDRGRFGALASALRRLRHDVVGRDPEIAYPVFCGFAFDDRQSDRTVWSSFPNARLFVPQSLLHMEQDRALLRINARVDPADSVDLIGERVEDLLRRSHACIGEHLSAEQPNTIGTLAIPDRRTWEASVATAVAMIEQGSLDKVVLAREERLLADGPWSAVATLDRLRAADPEATLFATQVGRSWFLGASPERLVRLNGGQVDVTCLAGTIGIGDSADEQRQLADALLASAKNREEHEIVVRSTVSALAELCDEVYRLPGTPRVATARAVQHLETPLTGRLSLNGNVLDLVERLHPTPAVGGYPTEAAISTIRELEEIDRGWYAGPIGWADVDGSGEFAVAIRSALLLGRTASLFAGGGIVHGSDPVDEFRETRLKLRPMLAALGAT